MTLTQAELSAELQARFAEAKRDFEAVEALSPEALAWRPAAKAWSLAQIAAHLASTNRQYLEVLRPVLAAADTVSGAADGDFRPTFIGRMLAKGVHPDGKIKLKAPASFQPNHEASAADVEAFLATQSELAALLAEHAQRTNLSRVKLASPESRLIRFSAADAFRILALHGQRHARQAERVQQAEGFPG